MRAALSGLFAGTGFMLAGNLAAQETQEPWRPAPSVTKVPYPLRPVVAKEKQRHERLSTMTLDGTFESYKPGTQVNQLRGDNGWAGVFFNPGGCTLANTGYKSGVSLFIPSGGGNTCGIVEVDKPFKPETWYRVSMMIKGIPYTLRFCYPVAAPEQTGEDANGKPVFKEDNNEIRIDHNHGGGYGFYYVCSKCDFVKAGTAEDGNWVLGGFRVIPDACPECGEEGSLYRDGDRRNYPEWTYIFADFKTSKYTGKTVHDLYYWYTVFIGSAANTWIDNFLVYEITGEGGDPVGGDKYVPPVAADSP